MATRAATLVLLAHAASARESSQWDAVVRNMSLCDASASAVSVTITQTAHAEATVEMSEKVWSFMWIEDRDQTVLAYLAYTAPAEAGSGSGVGIARQLAWTNWTSAPDAVRAVVRFDDCTEAYSDDVDTWKGTLSQWMSGKSKYDKTNLPADLKDDATWQSYTPVVALDYAAKQLTFTARLGDGNGTNHVAYVKVSCEDCGHRGGSAILLFGAIGESEDGNYVSGVVLFPALTERLEVCAAVVYSLECVTYNLVDRLVAEMEDAYPPVKAVTVFWRSAGEVSSVTSSSSTLKIRREDPTGYCTATPHYVYVRKQLGDATLLAHSDGGRELTVTVDAGVSSVQVFLQCGEDVVYNEIDVAALRAEVLVTLTLTLT